MPDTLAGARRSTPNGLPYTLMQGYPRGRVETFGKFSSEEQYLINASDLDAFITELMPSPVVLFDEVIWVPRYSMPGTDWAHLKELEFETFNPDKPCDPFDADPSAAEETYERLLVLSLRYNTDVDSQQDKDQQDPETFLDRTLSGTVETLAISVNNAKVKVETVDGNAGDDEVVKNPTTKVIKVMPIIEHNYSWKQAINPNFPRMASLLGSVNSKAYPWLLNAVIETVMFVGFGGKQEFQYLGRRQVIRPWQLDLKFAQKNVLDDAGDATPAGWNHVYNPDTQLFQRLKRVTKKGDRPLYRLADFDQIFRP